MEVTFTFISKFCNQTDGCTMGGPLSVTISDIYITKMERDAVHPFNLIFCHRYVDDTYIKKSKRKMTLTLFRMGFFRAAHAWGGQKGTPSLTSVTHIPQ